MSNVLCGYHTEATLRFREQRLKTIADLLVVEAKSQHQLTITAETHRDDDSFFIAGKISIPELQQEKQYEWKMSEQDFRLPVEQLVAEMVRKINNNVRRFVKEHSKQ